MLIDWFTVGAQALNFLVLVWLMKRFLYKPILDAIDEREKPAERLPRRRARGRRPRADPHRPPPGQPPAPRPARTPARRPATGSHARSGSPAPCGCRGRAQSRLPARRTLRAHVANGRAECRRVASKKRRVG